MAGKQPIRFYPRPLIWLGLMFWIALTIFASINEISQHNYEPMTVIIFAVAMTALSMAFVAGWLTLLIALVLNGAFRRRREAFRGPLLESFCLLATITVLFVWSLFLPS